MASVFKAYRTDAETAERVVKAACCLHNYNLRNNINVAGTETEEHAEPVRAFSDTSSSNLRSNNAAFEVREHFVTYFNRWILCFGNPNQ